MHLTQAAGTAALLAALNGSTNPIVGLELDGNQILAGRGDGWFADGCGGVAARRVQLAQAEVLAGLNRLLACRTTLKLLGLSDNDLGDAGLCSVAEKVRGAWSLADLDLSRNAGSAAKRGWMSRSGPALGRLIRESTTLTVLNLQWNTLSGPGAIDIARSLLNNTTLTSLNLGWNCFGKNAAIDCLGESLAGVGAGSNRQLFLAEPKCPLLELDLSYNAITDRKALHLAECIAFNTRLRKLRLDGNPLMMAGVAAMRRVVTTGDDFAEPLVISMDSCGAGSSAVNCFDVLHPAGSYVLDLSLEYDRVLVRKLVHFALSGEGEFVESSITLNQIPFQLALVQKSQDQRRKSLVIGKEVGNTSARNEAEQKKLALRVISSIQPRLTGRNDRAMLIPGTNLPLFGILRFDFGETSKPPLDGETVPMSVLEDLIKALQTGILSATMIHATVGHFLNGKYLSCQQASHVISCFKELHIYGEPVVVLATNLYKRLSDPENLNYLLGVMSKIEASSFLKFAGPLAFSFTLRNPTGHYVLDLSKLSEREVAERLSTWKNQETAYEDIWQKEKSQLGFPKLDFERIWKNASVNGRKHLYSTSAGIPTSGRLELDFVQISKPGLEAKALTDSNFDLLFAEKFGANGLHEEDPSSLVQYFRELSNIHLFSIRQVQSILIDITKAVYLGDSKPDQRIMHRWTSSLISTVFTLWRFENRKAKRFVRLICLVNPGSSLELYKLRAEIIVIAFARIVDWHGLGPLILEHLSRNECDDLERRLGRYNLFDKITAVGSYTIELSNKEHRRIMQELVRLAEVEEGRNFVDVTYNEKDFTIPAGWKQEIPTKGQVRFCYCRGPEVADRVRLKYINSPTWPQGFRERCGIAWVAVDRLKRVQQKLRARFADAASSFKQMDLDGGGTLNQAEISVGLFKLGVWFSPQEVRALVEILDVNGSNDLDLTEWNRFFYSRRISISEFVNERAKTEGTTPRHRRRRDSVIRAAFQ